MKSNVLQKIYLILLLFPSLLFGDNILSKVDLGKYPIKLQGFLDDKTITMHLVQNADKFEGFYYYEGFKRYLKLEGQLEPNSKLRVSEFNQKGSNTGDFIGEFNTQEFKGIWSKPDGSRSYSFSLYLMKGKIDSTVKIEKTDGNEVIDNSNGDIWLNNGKWILIGSILLIVIVGFAFNKKHKSHTILETTKNINITNNNFNINPENKGLVFENYIVSLFSKDYFIVKDATSDKSFDGRHVESNKNPDLILEISTSAGKAKFAVECKYRSTLNKKFPVEFCKDYQLKNYQNYGIEMGLDVFLALGVGGSPSKPEELFVFSLKNLKENTISFEQLVIYKKKSKNFFYDMSTKVLR